MKMKKAQTVYILLMFVLLLLLPMITFNFTGAEEIPEEKIILADYPVLDGNPEHFLSGEVMDETEKWMNDHIGCRSASRRIYGEIYHRLLKISTEEKVVFGKDGWLYSTENKNLEIAKGKYPLTEEKEAEIIEKQLEVLDHYNRRGIKYYLLLTPSKVSVYPENLPISFAGMASPSIVLEKAIGSRIRVINALYPLQQKKSEGFPLFFRTDTHWNSRGSYEAYRGLIAAVKPEENPVEIERYGQSVRLGDLNLLLGLTREEDQEESPIPEYAWKARKAETHADLKEALKKIAKKQHSAYIEPDLYFNPERAEAGTLLIYGDSMTAPWTYFPVYLAEHFEKVYVLRMTGISPELEEIIQPDYVVYQTTERFILPRLNTQHIV